MIVKKTQLPSRGYLYDGKLPDGWVEVRPMTMNEEKLLIGNKRERSQMLNKVIDNCLLTKDVSLSEMLVADRTYLLFFIREITYGSDYAFSMKCPSCLATFRHKLEIPKDLIVRVLESTDIEPFEVELPVCGKKVQLRHLRGKDEEAILKFNNQALLTGIEEEGDPSYVYRMARHIVAIEGKEVSITEAMDFCEQTVSRDSAIMQKAVRDNGCDLTMRLNFDCPGCGFVFRRSMPFTSDFFRPSDVTDE